MRLLTVLLVLLMEPLIPPSFSQEPIELHRKLDSRVEAYSLHCESLEDALTTVASDFQIPMGIQWIRDTQTSHRIDQSWNHVTASEIIKSLVSAYPGYEVRVGDVVEILPSAIDDEHDFLRLRVPSFQARNKWIAEADSTLHYLVKRLARHLPPPTPDEGEAGSFSAGPGGNLPVNVEALDVTLREILNRLIISAGQTTWVVTYPEHTSLMRNGLRRTASRDSGSVFEDEIQPVWVFVPWRRLGETLK
ncbi:MAG: hypothetical protein ABI693_34620 [Bryobacteraceae bacterium]